MMTPRQIAMQAEVDQAREQMADNIDRLRKLEPAFLVAVCDTIDSADGLAPLPASAQVMVPVLAFRVIAQLAKIGIVDVDGVLRRRKEDA